MLLPLRRLSVGIVIALSLGHSAWAHTVSICADPDPPPWTYWVRDAQGKPTDVFVGATLEIVKAAFQRIGTKVEFMGQYPWARCLLMVENGSIDFAMDGYYDTDRAKRFAYSDHYNTLTPQVFYRPDTPVVLNSINDLKKYKGCGMNGASYEHYGLHPTELDLGNGYERMIQKLQAKRCDYFVEELEIISGYKLSGKDYLANSGIKHGPVPGAKAPAKHLLTAINGPNAKLISKIDKAIANVIKSGEAAKAWKKHAGNESPYSP
jgi:ABC-type amino acid transport substrate-binding protein